jgi:dihydrofolate synthase/folylpolyglutamate synthase
LVDRWYFCDLPTERASNAHDLQKQWQQTNTRQNVTSSTYKDPQTALEAAVAAADPADRIVVFGSFFTVGGVLKDGIPRLDAPHLSS